jgi:primosomal protein N' (replication factor Y)
MVTKGHDFPRVTLVGVLLADTSLYASDFRAAERTFSQLTQVIGRAGRASSPGIAVVQTFSPANDVIRYASSQDYERFYESEIALRKSTLFPPFCDIAAFTLVSGEEKALFEAAEELRKNLGKIAEEKYSDVPLVVFGPFEAKIYKAAEKFRMQMMVKCRLSRRTRGMFRDILLSLTQHRKVSVGVDFNPL